MPKPPNQTRPACSGTHYECLKSRWIFLLFLYIFVLWAPTFLPCTVSNLPRCMQLLMLPHTSSKCPIALPKWFIHVSFQQISLKIMTYLALYPATYINCLLGLRVQGILLVQADQESQVSLDKELKNQVLPYNLWVPFLQVNLFCPSHLKREESPQETENNSSMTVLR